MPNAKKSLAETHPEVAKQWHPILNGDLKPEDVIPGSNKKVWWKCPKGDDHEWYVRPADRTNYKTGCPYCSNKKVALSNCLATTHPALSKQWHPTENGDLSPSDVTAGSHKKVWWKCEKGYDHIWDAIINTRTRNGLGCPICSNQKVVKSNSLFSTHPEITKQWHPTKNGTLTPYDVLKGSTKKVWWKCPKGDDHEWLGSVRRKTLQSCPICNGKKIVKSTSLATLNPELAKQWHPTKNGDLTAYDVSLKSNKKVWWKCPKGDDHEWKSSIASRFNTPGCSVCDGRTVVLSNCLATLNPGIAQKWHPTKNGTLTPYDVLKGSTKKVWWKCPKGDDHEWKSKISGFKNEDYCPVCYNHLVVNSNSLSKLNPRLSKEWHPFKNGALSPNKVPNGGKRKVWWKCDKGDDHEWYTSIESRIKGGNCPICSGQKVVLSNSLATLNPELAKQWHPTKNGKLTPLKFSKGSNKKVWWKCDKGDDHEWFSSINSRSKGAGCPICSNHIVSISNSMSETHPDLAKEWHPTKNQPLRPSSVVAGTGLKIWWKCNNAEDHEWRVSGNSRITFDSGCPFCTLTPQSKQELTITFELMKLFKNIDPKGLKTRLDGKLRAIDIFIPKLNLCIEFDGNYWHKDKRDIDKIKSEMLLEEGFKLIRVRQEPLKKIYDTDVISKQPYNGKQVTNDILSVILDMYKLDDKIVSKIKDYQSKDKLQNEKGLERYIDKILTEKAEKKSSKTKTAK
jgi:hypothetical protein